MKNNIKFYSQSNSEVDGKSLQASQQLQSDKQTYGSEYIHLYVDDIEVYEDDTHTSYSKEGKANSGEFVVKLGIWDDVFGGGYYLKIENSSEEKEKFEEHTESPTFSLDEYKLIQEYLKKLDAAKWQTKSVELNALPE